MAQNRALALGGIGSPCCCPSGTPVTVCSPCDIPQADLTFSYTNAFSGGGSATMTFTGGIWTTGCLNTATSEQTYTLLCNSGQIELRAIGYTGAPFCPSGTSNYCSNLRSPPTFQLVFASHSCLPSFSLVFTLNPGTCGFLSTTGDTGYTITYP